jgi:hypothetical protein
LWGCDLTMETGLAKLRALGVIGLSADDLERIRWRTAVSIFPAGSLLDEPSPRTVLIAGQGARA